jgi:hypothetical protein
MYPGDSPWKSPDPHSPFESECPLLHPNVSAMSRAQRYAKHRDISRILCHLVSFNSAWIRPAHIFPVKSNATFSSGPCSCNRRCFAFSVGYPTLASLALVRWSGRCVSPPSSWVGGIPPVESESLSIVDLITILRGPNSPKFPDIQTGLNLPNQLIIPCSDLISSATSNRRRTYHI